MIRTARAMGLRTVAVYSEADSGAMHVAEADEAVLLGPARARDSYLNIERVLEAARATGAEAIHPGYGFLSENAEFAEACAKAGIVFVGPTAAMMTAMGSKSGSKALMEKAGVPLVAGYHGEAQDEATLSKAADRIGFPVLVKASAGGGGRGMRVVRAAAELGPAIVSAKREAKAAFGDDRMLIEKYVDNPRHIEVQVIGDSHGNLLSLFERECTLQRRHQKVIEEAPSPTLDAKQREAVCAAARKAAGAVNYVGAGTIEFVSDGKDVFFIEMNTRLQVEHPVTELITGIDLVEWQLRVAFGEKLPLTQDQIRLNGHAIEARVYAENPNKNFMPSVGKIRTWHLPDETGGLRIDAGYRGGDTVSPYYDAMLAKVIAWSPTREGAIDRLNRGLEETDVRGIVTNIPFLAALVTHKDVRANRIDTGFIERELKALTPEASAPGDLELAAAATAILIAGSAARSMPRRNRPGETSGWMPVGRRRRVFKFRAHGVEQEICFHYGKGPATWSIGAARAFLHIRDDGRRRLRSDTRWRQVAGRRRRRGSRALSAHAQRPFRAALGRSVRRRERGADRRRQDRGAAAGHGRRRSGGGGRKAGEGGGDPHPRSDEDGTDLARAVRRHPEGDQVQGRRHRAGGRRTRRVGTGRVRSI